MAVLRKVLWCGVVCEGRGGDVLAVAAKGGEKQRGQRSRGK